MFSKHQITSFSRQSRESEMCRSRKNRIQPQILAHKTLAALRHHSSLSLRTLFFHQFFPHKSRNGNNSFDVRPKYIRDEDRAIKHNNVELLNISFSFSRIRMAMREFSKNFIFTNDATCLGCYFVFSTTSSSYRIIKHRSESRDIIRL